MVAVQWYPEASLRIRGLDGQSVSSTYHQVFTAATDSADSPTRDNVHAASIIAYTWFGLVGDAPLGLRPTEVVIKFRNRLTLAIKGVGDPVLGLTLPKVISNLAKLADAVLANIGTGFITPSDLTLAKRTPITKEILHCIKVVDPSVLQFVLSFLQHGKKAEWVDPDFDSVALRRWVEVEEDLGRLQLDDLYVDGMRDMVSRILTKSPQEYPFKPKFGPGHVLEEDIGRKLDAKVLDIMLRHRTMRDPRGRFQTSPHRELWNRIARERESAVTHVMKVSNHPSMRSYLQKRGLSTQDYERNSENVKPLRASRRKFVVKDVGTSRTIAMEENSTMIKQQGVRSRLDGAIRENLGRHVRLDDQSVNRDWARQSSVDKQFDTLDLKDASDRTSWILVSQCFPREWVSDLNDCKADYVLEEIPIIDDLSLRSFTPVHKFAPMGSAVCFPVETIVFAAAIMLAAVVRRFEVTTQIPRSSWADISYDDLKNTMGHDHLDALLTMEDFGVYGDDLIVDSRTSPYVEMLLEELGFRVSPSKCFRGKHPFRESCGGWYLEGVDVRPVRIRLKGISHMDGSKVLMSLVSTANQLFDINYRHCRKAVISVLENVLYYWSDFTSLVKNYENKIRKYANREKRQGPNALITVPEVSVGKLPLMYSRKDDFCARYPTVLYSSSSNPNSALPFRYDMDGNGVGTHRWEYLALHVKMEEGFDIDHTVCDPYLLDQVELALKADPDMWHPTKSSTGAVWSGKRKSLINVDPDSQTEHAVCMPGWKWFAVS